MDESLLPKLKKAARNVVRAASQRGGPIDRGEFTMAQARAQIAAKMGLSEDGLDEKPWKTDVKRAVEHELEDLPERTGEAESSKLTSPSPAAIKTPAKEDDAALDVSSLSDEPPTRKRRGATKGVASAKKTETQKAPDQGMSPDENRIANLKKIVVACGVRKQWSKEFSECPTKKTRSQIAHLHGLLADLGMKGTPTIGKAKAIKEKRELAAELDDVREFAAKRGAHGRGRSAKSGAKSGSPEVQSRSATPQEKEETAFDAVMDFLGDQSD